METIKDLKVELEKILKGCGVKLSEEGFCAYRGLNKWRMCSKCRKNYDNVKLRISVLKNVSDEISRFIATDVGFGGVQTKNFQKLQVRITG